MKNFDSIRIRLNIILLLILMIVAPSDAISQNKRTEFQDRIYNAFISGNMVQWERTITEMEQYYSAFPLPDMLYDLLLTRYGFIPYCLDEDKKDLARQHLDKAEEELERLFVYNRYQAHAFALRGAFLGFRISLRPLSAIRLGPRSYRAIDDAMEADPGNPAVWMEKGNTRFYTPSTFGGSKEEARDSYKKAVELFENDLQPNQRWLYLNSLVGLAKSYQYTDQERLAVVTLEKALKYEPGFKWVKEELLPEARKRLQ